MRVPGRSFHERYALDGNILISLIELPAGVGRDLSLAQHVDDFGESPVEHERLAELADHDVERFEIAVQDSLVVSEPNRLTDRDELSQQSSEPQLPLGAAARQGVHRVDRLFHIAALEQLHGIKRSPVFPKADVVDRNDPRMLKLSRDLCLFQKPFDDDGVLQRPGQQFFEGDLAVNAGVFGSPDVAQAAVREVVEQLIPVLRPRRVR